MIYSIKREDNDLDFWFGIGDEDPNRYFLCTASAESAKEVGKLLKEGMRMADAHAAVIWKAVDVIDRLQDTADITVSREWANEFLEDIENRLEERMINKGWDVIIDNLPDNQQAADKMFETKNYS